VSLAVWEGRKGNILHFGEAQQKTSKKETWEITIQGPGVGMKQKYSKEDKEEERSLNWIWRGTLSKNIEGN